MHGGCEAAPSSGRSPLTSGPQRADCGPRQGVAARASDRRAHLRDKHQQYKDGVAATQAGTGAAADSTSGCSSGWRQAAGGQLHAARGTRRVPVAPPQRRRTGHRRSTTAASSSMQQHRLEGGYHEGVEQCSGAPVAQVGRPRHSAGTPGDGRHGGSASAVALFCSPARRHRWRGQATGDSSIHRKEGYGYQISKKLQKKEPGRLQPRHEGTMSRDRP